MKRARQTERLLLFRGKCKSQSTSTRKKAAKHLAVFLLSMLLFTMISRGIYAYQMPRVVIGQVSARSISHTLQAEGSILAAKETAVVLMQGIRIREICVKTGEKVGSGSPLLYLDEEDIKNLMEEADEKIQVTEAKIAERSRRDPADRSGILEEQYTLAHLQRQYSDYQKLSEKKGRIDSGADGYVLEIYAKAGDRTPDSAVMLLAGGTDEPKDPEGPGVSAKWIFQAGLTQEQADVIKAGDTVRLQFQNGKIQAEGCQVSSVRQKGDGTYEAAVAVTESSLSPGESGTMEMTSQSGQYTCCVPQSAIYSDGDKNYVLLIRETDTILGTELSVVRRDVAVVDQNESTVALADGELGAEERFVVYADKDAASGDKVRLFEEEDKS